MFLFFLLFFLHVVSVYADGSKWTSPWYFLGPWNVGKTEIDGFPIFAPPYRNMFPTNVSIHKLKRHNDSYFSEMVTGGRVAEWSTVQNTDRQGYTQLDISQFRTNVHSLVRLSSSLTIQEFQGFLSRDFNIPKNKEGTYGINCLGLHTIAINGEIYHGDVYSSEQMYAVIHLRAGTHHITSRVRGKGTARFRCQITGPHQHGAVKLFSPPPVELPDIVEGKLLTPFLAIRVLNLGLATVSNFTFTAFKKNFKKKNKKKETQIKIVVSKTTSTFQSFPGQTLALPIEMHLEETLALSMAEQDRCLEVTLNMHYTYYTKGNNNIQRRSTKVVHIPFRCRRADQSQLMTFISHDGTVASAALLRPRQMDACRSNEYRQGCPVVLAMSGVGVKPTHMADAFKYKQMSEPGEDQNFIFGLPFAWILSPERSGAHNFEGTGHLTAVSSLNALSSLFATIVDVGSVIYAGHSRGGHGSLLFATHRPDHACGIFSSNGWIRREYYGDANPIFDMDLQLSHADPTVIRRIFESSISENDVSISAPNMIGIPTLLRTSSDDSTAHPWFMRRIGRILKSWEKETATNTTKTTEKSLVEFEEFKSGGHWWWDSQSTNDGGVMFDKQVQKFLERSLQQCRFQHPKRRFHLVSLNPSTFHGRHGVRILQFNIPFRIAKVFAEKKVDGVYGVWLLRTSNVRRLSIVTNNEYFIESTRIIIDDQTIQLPTTPVAPVIHFIRDTDDRSDDETSIQMIQRWRVYDERKENSYLIERGPGTSGPMRQIFDLPFIIVVNDTSTLSLGIMLANSHYAGSKTTAPVYFPHQVSAEMKRSYNIIFIGRSTMRDEMYRLNDIQFSKNDGGFVVHRCQFRPGDYAGIVFLAPSITVDNPEQLILVIDGTDRSALIDLFHGSYSSNTPLTRAMFTNMYPDFIVTNGHQYQWKGLGGLYMSGYFSWNWGWDVAMSSTSHYCPATADGIPGIL